METVSLGPARTYDMREFCYFKNRLRHLDDIHV